MIMLKAQKVSIHINNFLVVFGLTKVLHFFTVRRPGIYSMHHPQNIRFNNLRGIRGKFLVSLQIKCMWRVRLIGIDAYMISCAPINLYL